MVGWWRRHERDLERTEKEFRKTEMEKSAEIQRRNLEKQSRTSFVKQFFPGVNAIPGPRSNLRKLAVSKNDSKIMRERNFTYIISAQPQEKSRGRGYYFRQQFGIKFSYKEITHKL